MTPCLIVCLSFPVTDVALPTRVLDIGSGYADPVRLIEVAAGQRGRYTALSHCWGGGIGIRTTTENYAAQKKGLRYCDLPLSFQHATTVTRGLGLRYLWIDALCIIQDSKSDWEVESGNMAAIYQNAYIVIGADMSSDSDGGFLDVRSGGYNGDGRPIATIDDEIIYARSENRMNNEFQRNHPLGSDPLSTRAWTLQEQMLSSRMVHFASKEMVWECKSVLCCECLQLDRQGVTPNSLLSFRALIDSSDSYSTRFRTWYSLVDQVTYRKLTEPQDLLPCLSGIAQRFQNSGAGSYLAGLWNEDLPMGLLWSQSKDQKCSRAIPYRGPSWSWASIDGIEDPYGSRHKHDNLLEKVYAKIMEAKCVPAGKDHLGAVSGGLLKVSAPLVKLEKGLGVLRLYDCDDFEEENVFCLLIGKTTGGPYSRPVCGLLLRQQLVSTSTFERVGRFTLESGSEVKLFQGVDDTIVTII